VARRAGGVSEWQAEPVRFCSTVFEDLTRRKVHELLSSHVSCLRQGSFGKPRVPGIHSGRPI